MVRLLDFIQCRYGGTRYLSRYFDAEVEFTPTCEPEDAEPLRIDYVVYTGSVTGAHIDGDAQLWIGLDQQDVIDFDGMDNLIECDARLDLLHDMPYVRDTYHADPPSDDDLLASLRGLAVDAVRVDKASGRLTSVFAGIGLVVCIKRVWHALGGVMPPMIHVGADNEVLLERTIAFLRAPHASA